MSWVGRKLIIKKDGVPIAGARAKSVRFNNEPINVSHEEEDGFRHLLDVLDTREVMLSIEGVLSGPHAEQLIRPKVDGELIDVEVVFPDESTLSADGAYIHSLQITGEHRNAVMFAASLVLSGRWLDEPPLPTTWAAGEWAASFIAYDMVYAQGMFVVCGQSTAVGATSIVTSEDGVNWTFRTVPVSPYHILRGIAYGNGRFVAVGRRQTSGYYAIYSDDGINWSACNTNSSLVDSLAVAFKDGRFVLSNRFSIVGYSDDGVNWTYGGQIIGPQNYDLHAIEAHNGFFYCVGGAGGGNAAILVSSDGVSWSQFSTGGWSGGDSNATFEPFAIGWNANEGHMAGRRRKWAIHIPPEGGWRGQDERILNDEPAADSTDFVFRVGGALGQLVAVGRRAQADLSNNAFVATAADNRNWVEREWNVEGNTGEQFYCFADNGERLVVAGTSWATWF